MDVPLPALEIVAEVEQLGVDSSTLLKWKFFQISQYYLVIDILFYEASKLPQEGLPEGVFLDVVGT